MREERKLLVRFPATLIFFFKSLKIIKFHSRVCPKVAKLSSQTLRVLCRLCEAKENVAKLSSQMLQDLRELCEALNSNECEIRGCEAFVSNAPRRTLTLRSSQLL